jgi:hypothetical protein
MRRKRKKKLGCKKIGGGKEGGWQKTPAVAAYPPACLLAALVPITCEPINKAPSWGKGQI